LTLPFILIAIRCFRGEQRPLIPPGAFHQPNRFDPSKTQESLPRTFRINRYRSVARCVSRFFYDILYSFGKKSMKNVIIFRSVTDFVASYL